MADAKIARLIGAWPLFLLTALWSCASSAPPPKLAVAQIGALPLWIAEVRNATTNELRLPTGNPLQSLAEMSGKVSSQHRPTVMSALRRALKHQLEKSQAVVRLPEEHGHRLPGLPSGAEPAARIARESGLEGLLLLSEIRRWEGDAPGLIRVWVELRLVRIADGTSIWEGRVQRALASTRIGNPGQAHQDAVKEVLRELF